MNVVDLAVEIARNLTIIGRCEPSKTPATMGREQLAYLRLMEAITPASLDPTLPPILTSDALMQLHVDFDTASKSSKISPSEAVLTALLTPSLARIVQEVANETQSGLAISNTEFIQWLAPTLYTPMREWKKPNLITAHPSMMISRKQNGGNVIVNYRNSLADWNPANCDFGGVEATEKSIGLISSLWEGKCELGNMSVALGEMMDYVKCFVVNKSMISFILYDKFGFVGGYANAGVINSLMVHTDDIDGIGPTVIPWDAKGSKDVLMTLLKTSITDKMVLLEKVKTAFNASWKSCGEGKSPYLGSGGFGDVYCVEVQG
jgi:hypothetical protein